jgi:GT2 family glycosyltransferase
MDRSRTQVRDFISQHPRELSGLPRISVVISSYSEGRWKDLLAAVESVRAQTAAPLETIVVIDHNPALFDRARHHFGGVSSIRVLQSAGQEGLSTARNTGVAAAAGDVIAFLDDDAMAERAWLARLGRHYADSAVMAVGGAIKPRWVGGRPKSFPPEFDWVVGCTYRGLPETAQPVRNIIGANMSFRRGVLEAVGGFRADIGRVGARPLGCEETELCLRAASTWVDCVILYEPRARVWHTVTPARGSWRYFLRRCYAEGLSKAVVGRLAGVSRGLQSERAYVVRTVPRGIAANVVAAFSERDATHFLRAARMIVGVFATTMGYCVGAARIVDAARASNSPASDTR